MTPQLDLDTCPRCAAEVDHGQEYCLECGGRLPLARGALPALAGAWRARVRWYPGDWIWTTLLLLGIAGAATAVAVAAAEPDTRRTDALVATYDRPAPTTTAPRAQQAVPAGPRDRGSTTADRTTTGAQRRAQLIEWPVGRTAFTVVLTSLPSTTGRRNVLRLARRASRTGLPDVGLLDSSRFPSLHPGYYVIFSGIYESADDAASALADAQERGYDRAYTRQIVA